MALLDKSTKRITDFDWILVILYRPNIKTVMDIRPYR